MAMVVWHIVGAATRTKSEGKKADRPAAGGIVMEVEKR